ncbi:NAD-dependent epimerase [Halobacteriovorax sp. CON-3]|uniref:NAD-dependent epimerase n=1 Tax=Halobacteriovorax sp. CON-3 TaxID=3157710 RepID=UPI003721279F
MRILVTGVAGFIGFHTAKMALELGHTVIGIDSINSYYDVKLKNGRLKELGIENFLTQSDKYKKFKFFKIDISNWENVKRVFEMEKIDQVIHLAAQAGVRYSIENPHSYIKSNAEGFLNILEGCRHYKIKHLIYASSSSVYGENSKVPFSVKDPVDHPVSLYAATKRANELMAHTYSHLYDLPTTGLRFFTVYGPWGRPDMAPFIFTDAILNNKKINVYNYGDMERDFTYVDDVVQAQLKLLDFIPCSSKSCDHPNESTSPFKIYNIGNSSPVKLGNFINILETSLGVEADKNMMPLQPGDVLRTYADVKELYEVLDFKPETAIDTGVKKFVDWYREYYL